MDRGNIVVLNGTSSSGKSSIARALQEVMDTPYLHTGTDHFMARFPQRFAVPSDGVDPATADGFLLVFRDGVARTFATPDGRAGYAGATLAEVRIGPVGLRLLAGMYRAVAVFAAAGNDVVADVVIHDPRELQAAVTALAGSAPLFVGVRLPRAVAERREAERGDRAKGGAVAFYDLVHAHGFYDLELDTSVLSPMECALRIKEALQSGHPRDAFRQLAQRLAG